jgi:3-hydroxyacyl-CoA dehydrogenase
VTEIAARTPIPAGRRRPTRDGARALLAQLVNEAAFLIGEGNGTPEDIDAGLNHPRGPVEWAGIAGLADLLAILDALHSELGEPRYRAAPLLRRRAALSEGLASPTGHKRASP